MRHFLSKFLILFTLLLGNIFLMNAQNVNITLVVTKTNGEEQTFQLSEESQLYFENGDQLVIDDGAGTTVTFQLAEIQKMICTEYAGIGENNATTLWLAPNPTRNNFIINNLQNNCTANIYTLDGRLVKSFEASGGQVVDISDLVPGMYLLHIDGQTLKMMKL